MNMTHERLTSPCLIMFQGAIYSVQPKLISLFRFISSCSLGLRFQVCSDWDIGSVCFFQFLSSQAQFTCGNKMNRMKHMKQCSNCFRFKHNHWVHGLSMAFLHAVQGRGSPPYWFFCQPTELIKMWIFIVASSTTAAWRTIPTGGVTWIAGIAFLFLWGVTYRCLMDHPCWIYTLNHTYSTYIYYISYIYFIYVYIYIIYIYILCMYTSSYCLSIGNPAAVVGPFMNPTSS